MTIAPICKVFDDGHIEFYPQVLTDVSVSLRTLSMAWKLARAVQHLQENPFHPGLQSHEIDALSARYGQKVFESYLENDTPATGRIFWVYGPRRHFITLIGMEPHPQDSKRGYARVLSPRYRCVNQANR